MTYENKFLEQKQYGIIFYRNYRVSKANHSLRLQQKTFYEKCEQSGCVNLVKERRINHWKINFLKSNGVLLKTLSCSLSRSIS